MHEPIYWPIAQLTAAYARGELDPVDMAKRALARIAALNPTFNAVVCPLDDLALEQAEAARRAYQRGGAGPLSGVPVSIKDTFDIAGYVATRGSLVHRTSVSQHDSGCIRRLRAAGAVFVGKTNTAEFGQSATTENRLGDATRNPWDTRRTPGGSSGGAAASVAAGFATIALGADGGGSIRIPAAFTGLAGVKPTYGLCRNEDGFRGMSDFVCPGPIAWRIADARVMLGVLADASFPRRPLGRSLRIAWCPNVEDRPVDPRLIEAAAGAVRRITALGHSVDEARLKFEGWDEAFGPLVLDEERRERGHLLKQARDQLTEYELRTLEAATALTEAAVAEARAQHAKYQAHIDALFERYDVILTPATAVPAFPIDERPKQIAGRKVDALWGAFPFTPAFNVAGTPAVSLPCGFVDGLPVGVQLVAARGKDALLLDVAEDLEEAMGIDRSDVIAQWAQPPRATRALS
jgi:Asp-tRNA(Asn)/Glu-tRNA(Gln) amidotransferase A subunit family amidase